MPETAGRQWSPAPIGALRAFEAAARHMSFTRAAEELGVTQSAVSHSIREIEARLETNLFRRDGKRLELTDAGRRYAPHIRNALAQLHAGDLAVSDPGRRARVLTVSVSPSFAAKWLAPRIGDFAARHPDLDLRISAASQHVDFSDGDIDLAIRHGDGGWPALDCVRLCTEMWLPVCNPSLAAVEMTVSDIAQLPLIHHRDAQGWRRWFEREGVRLPENSARGLTFSEMSLAIDAAAAGQGVALARSALAARDLIAGRLACPARTRQPAEIAYWIVRPKDRTKSRKIIRFIAWLRAEAAAEETALAALLARSEP